MAIGVANCAHFVGAAISRPRAITNRPYTVETTHFGHSRGYIGMEENTRHAARATLFYKEGAARRRRVFSSSYRITIRIMDIIEKKIIIAPAPVRPMTMPKAVPKSPMSPPTRLSVTAPESPAAALNMR